VRNIVARTIVFFVGIAVLAATILFVPHRNHLAINLIAVVVSGLGARELSRLFADKETGYKSSHIVIPILGAALPLAQLLVLNGIIPESGFPTAIYIVVAMIFLVQIFRTKEEDFGHTLSNTAANITVVIYPGLFLSYFIRISEFESASALIVVFLAITFANDTLAYIIGSLFKVVQVHERGADWRPRVTLPVSPNKTLIGFGAGWIGSIAAAALAVALFGRFIPLSLPVWLLIGAVVGFAVILGDLIESALKRSATRKDSGALIPGRGGVLDSVDSVLYAAPVFYYLLRYFL
jgi:phosphatidate cytidylyltransferase